MKYAPCTMRRIAKEDTSFIYNSWLKSYRENSAWARSIPAQIYYDNHKKVVGHILAQSAVVVACNPDMYSQIFGYAVYQPSEAGISILHYLYVKHPYRRLGIATALFKQALREASQDPSSPCVATHLTRTFEEFLAKPWNVIYNPYILGTEVLYGETSVFEACE